MLPPTRVFWEKRLQTIENKGNECRKACKETTKRRQADVNKRVGMPEGLKLNAGNDGAYTRVATRSMRKLLRAEGMRALRGADDDNNGGSG